MKRDLRLRALLIFLMAAATISFALCVTSNVQMSSVHVPLPDELAVALTWLIGHGLHGAIVVLLPAVYLLLGRSLILAPANLSDHRPVQ